MKNGVVSPSQAGCLDVFIAQGLWTKDRALNCGYIIEDSSCEFCHECLESWKHMLFYCKHERVANARKS
eukprot:11217659-Lingulodinium_polyedra.AAC.1